MLSLIFGMVWQFVMSALCELYFTLKVLSNEKDCIVFKCLSQTCLKRQAVKIRISFETLPFWIGLTWSSICFLMLSTGKSDVARCGFRYKLSTRNHCFRVEEQNSLMH